jgi:extracellular factor (EF) 3-hydroxypalmitic acid methyl ester biosynthesis protein
VISLRQACIELYENFSLLSLQPTRKDIEQYLQHFTEVISKLEHTYSRAEILHEINPIRQAVAASPFLHRAQTWPRGYAGDFETIDYLLSGQNKTNPEEQAWHFEEYFLNSPICLQHFNKIKVQSRLIQQVLQRNTYANILSIGCGTSEDLVQVLPALQNSQCRITLIDVDRQALDHSMQRLQSIDERLTVQQGNIYKLARQIKGSYDLIIIGGVFDYLSNRVIVSLLDHLPQHLHANGVLYFSNIGKNNPYRICMEYLSDWILIERSKADIMALLNNTAAANMNCRMEYDVTGITWLVTLQATSIEAPATKFSIHS